MRRGERLLGVVAPYSFVYIRVISLCTMDHTILSELNLTHKDTKALVPALISFLQNFERKFEGIFTVTFRIIEFEKNENLIKMTHGSIHKSALF